MNEIAARSGDVTPSPCRSTRSCCLAVLASLPLGAAAEAQEAITRVSVDSAGVEGWGHSGYLSFWIGYGCGSSSDGGFGGFNVELYTPPSMSSDGRHVAFDSSASNLVSNDTNGRADVFVHDRIAGTTTRVSVDPSGFEFEQACVWPSISSDGRFVAFATLWTECDDAAPQVYVHDRDPDANGVFDEGNGITTLVSVDSSGDELFWSWSPSIAGDGTLVAFASLSYRSDGSQESDVFVHDLLSGETTRVSVDSTGAEANGWSDTPVISADGSTVAFWSSADNLVTGDTNAAPDIFVHDRLSGTTTRVSVDSSGSEGNGWGAAGGLSLSADGWIVAFTSYSDNLVAGDTNGVVDVFVHDRVAGTTERVSVDSSGLESVADSGWPALSADGQVVAFNSRADNLVGGDSNGLLDVFLHDRATAATSLVSINCGNALGNGDSHIPSLSADGLLVAFTSYSDNLVTGDTNGAMDVFVRDRSVIEPDASWTNYGTGFPGTYGEPTLTASADPVLGTTITIDIGNSLGFWTVGFLLVGADEASIPTQLGGTLLVDVVFVLPLAIWPAGYSLPAELPTDPELCGAAAYLQILELDPGAQHGVSFSPGLNLLLGH
jgi:Tol biopolymer transport system component